MNALPIPCDAFTTSEEVFCEKPTAAFFAPTAGYSARTFVMGENSFHRNDLRCPRAVPDGRSHLMAWRHTGW